MINYVVIELSGRDNVSENKRIKRSLASARYRDALDRFCIERAARSLPRTRANKGKSRRSS